MKLCVFSIIPLTIYDFIIFFSLSTNKYIRVLLTKQYFFYEGDKTIINVALKLESDKYYETKDKYYETVEYYNNSYYKNQ